MSKTQKTEFIQKVEAFVSETHGEANKGDVALIAIAVDASDEGGDHVIMGLEGRGNLLAGALAQFLGRPETRAVVERAFQILAETKLGEIAEALGARVGAEPDPQAEPEGEPQEAAPAEEVEPQAASAE